MSRSLGTDTAGLVRALLAGEQPARRQSGRLAQLATSLKQPTKSQVWLLLSVYGRALPLDHEVESATRLARHEGTIALLRQLTSRRRRPSSWFTRNVEIVTETVFLDVHDTASTSLGTGVQRVARNLSLHWLDRGVQLVGWSANRTQLLRVSAEAFRARRRSGVLGRSPVVPWNAHYVLGETINEPARSGRVQALATHADVTSSLIAYDTIPLTIAETAGPRMPGVFAKYLAAASRFDRAATISDAAATEFHGWRRMLGSAGLVGPELHTVPLVIDVGTPSATGEAAARQLLNVAGPEELPLIMCVGSHEPRKNHDAVLHAAETLWREGHNFSLAFVGGNAWGSEEFSGSVTALRQNGRPITIVTGAPDDVLWWGYKIAHFTVFPSLGEGFGLPVAESLAAGTPVVTSNFGSMAELARGGGCELVDPRDDASLARGMRALLTNEPLRQRLADEAMRRTTRTWQNYADEVWRALVE